MFKTSATQQNLKAARERHVMYRKAKIKMKAAFLLETMQERRQRIHL